MPDLPPWPPRCPSEQLCYEEELLPQLGEVIIALGDVVGATTPDLLVAANVDGPEGAGLALRTYESRGSEAFAAPFESLLPGLHANAMVVAAVDGDTTGDLVVLDQMLPGVWYVPGDTSGTFEAATPIVLAEVPEFLAAGDLTADGVSDVAVLLASSASLVVLSQFDGAGAEMTTFATGLDPASAVAIAPLGPDGVEHVLVAGQMGVEQVLRVAMDIDPAPIVWEDTAAVFGDIFGIAVSDFDGDAFADVALASASEPALWWYTGNGGGTFEWSISTVLDETVETIVAGRWRAGAPPGVAIVQGGIIVLHEFDTDAWYDLAGVPVRPPLRARDLDGDGRDEIAAVTAGGDGVVVWWSVPA